MQPKDNILQTYNTVAAKYAGHYMNELDHKPLDRLLLRSFYDENKHKGAFIDLGCGPGQTTKFLTGCGCEHITGTDISPEMIAIAKALNPAINFEIADMLNLKYDDDLFGAAIAFYSIVHFDYPVVKTAFTEINRVLKTGGQFLFSFHTGDEVVHLDQLLEETVNIDFHFLDTDKIITLLKETGFSTADALIRFPYHSEHPSKRAYIRAEKI